jgi:hypothetical protein
MGVVRDKYPNALNGPRFGIGDINLGDDTYHIIDIFGNPWCEAEGEITVDEEPSKLEYMCPGCMEGIDEEEAVRIAGDL